MQLVREVLEPRVELVGEQLLRALVLDQEDGDRPRNSERRVVHAGRHVQEQVDENVVFPCPPSAPSRTSETEADDRPPVVVREHGFALLALERR